MGPTYAELKAAIYALKPMQWDEAALSQHTETLWRHEPLMDAIEAVVGRYLSFDGQVGPSYDECVRIAKGLLVDFAQRSECGSIEELVRWARHALQRNLGQALVNDGGPEATGDLGNAARSYKRLVRKAGLRIGATDAEVALATRETVEKVAERRRAYELQHASIGHYTDVVSGPLGIPVVVQSRRRGRRWRNDDEAEHDGRSCGDDDE